MKIPTNYIHIIATILMYKMVGCKSETSEKPKDVVSISAKGSAQPVSKTTVGPVFCDLKTRCEEFDASSQTLVEQISKACNSYSGNLGNGKCTASDYHAGCRYSDIVSVPGAVLGPITASQIHWVFLSENQRKPGNEHLIEQLCESGGVAIDPKGKILSKNSDEKKSEPGKDPTQGKEGTWEYD